MTLDLGHGQILPPTLASEPETQINASFELIAAYAKDKGRIRHVHLHDNHGGDHVRDDLHLPLGEGCVDFAGILSALRATGYDGAFSFEVALDAAVRGRDRVRAIWESEPGCWVGGDLRSRSKGEQ
jgi:hypothetical protein